MSRYQREDAEYVYRVVEVRASGKPFSQGPYGAQNAAKGVFTRLVNQALRWGKWQDTTYKLQRSKVEWETVEEKFIPQEEAS